MGLFLNTNVASLNANRNLFNITSSLNKSLERLSSGYKINSAADGAAELLISEGLRAQIRGSQAAMTNVQQGIDMLNTADSAMQQTYEHLQRMREIAVEAANGTVSDYTSYNNELAERSNAIDGIANNTIYNEQVLLDGSIAGGAGFNIQTGANAGEQVDIASAFADNTAATLGVSTTTLTSAADANTLIGEIDTAMANLDGNMATVGGFTNQLQDQMNFLSVAVENLSASEASIRNTDIAQETANLARLQILQQAAAAALSQANQMPSIALQLLG